MDSLLYAYIAAFLLAFYILVKSADYAILFGTRLARQFNISEFAISFFLVGLVSALPETVIALSAGFQSKPDIAIISLLSSNVVDLTFVFGIVTLFAAGLKIEANILRREVLYLGLLALPFILGYDGVISRAEGAALIVAGAIFLISVASEQKLFVTRIQKQDTPLVIRTTVLLIISVLVMSVAAAFTVSFVSLFAQAIGIPPTLIAVFVIGIGVCLPEILFTIRTLQQHKYEMALGNILGVVIIDSTIMLGLVAVLTPLHTTAVLVRVNGFFNIVSGIALIYFLKFQKKLSRWEAVILLGVYCAFAATQFLIR